MRFMLLFHSLPFYLEQMLSKASWIIFRGHHERINSRWKSAAGSWDGDAVTDALE